MDVAQTFSQESFNIADDMHLMNDCDLFSGIFAYDCMWTGEEGGWSYRHEESPPSPVDVKPPVMQVPTSQQSLLKPDLKLTADPNSVVPMMPNIAISPLPPFLNQTPPIITLTPPISDDESTKPTQNFIQNDENALSDNEQTDGELNEYFGRYLGEISDDGEFDDIKPDIHELILKPYFDDLDEIINEEQRRMDDEEEKQKISRYAASDHSYHKGTKEEGPNPGSLGMDTPSDSEEEIDVVSLGDKFNANLPTNPSTKDRRHIQRTMQSRFPQGVKTIMPLVRRGGKRIPEEPREKRQYKKGKATKRQYRKYRNDSDSEHEPSEKRHLHNNMERQRRIDLRNLFNELKRVVPDVNRKPRAAKVQILRGAAAHIEFIQNKHQENLHDIDTLKKRQMYLRARLSKLRRDVAARR